MIEVTATVRLLGPTDQVDALLRQLLQPHRSVRVEVVEAERKRYDR